jgi:hypothetical protein
MTRWYCSGGDLMTLDGGRPRQVTPAEATDMLHFFSQNYQYCANHNMSRIAAVIEKDWTELREACDEVLKWKRAARA